MTPIEQEKLKKAILESIERNMSFSNKFAEAIKRHSLQHNPPFKSISQSLNKANLAFAQSHFSQNITLQNSLLYSTQKSLEAAVRPTQELLNQINDINKSQFELINIQIQKLAKSLNTLVLQRTSIEQQLLDSFKLVYEQKVRQIQETGDYDSLNEIQETVDQAILLTEEIKEKKSDVFIILTKYLAKLLSTNKIKDITVDLLKGLLIQLLILLIIQPQSNQTITINNQTITINNIIDNSNPADIYDLKILISNTNVNLRTRKDAKSRIIYTIPPDTEVRVLQEYHKWILIALVTDNGENVIGYSYKMYFE